MDFKAVGALEQIILAIVIVIFRIIVVGDFFVGIKDSLVTETAQNRIVEALKEKFR